MGSLTGEVQIGHLEELVIRSGCDSGTSTQKSVKSPSQRTSKAQLSTSTNSSGFINSQAIEVSCIFFIDNSNDNILYALIETAIFKDMRLFIKKKSDIS